MRKSELIEMPKIKYFLVSNVILRGCCRFVYSFLMVVVNNQNEFVEKMKIVFMEEAIFFSFFFHFSTSTKIGKQSLYLSFKTPSVTVIQIWRHRIFPHSEMSI